MFAQQVANWIDRIIETQHNKPRERWAYHPGGGANDLGSGRQHRTGHSAGLCAVRAEHFRRVVLGAALGAAITTPVWTPLFAMAAVVIAEVGGPLSHSSTVAREYGIPAELGTGVATQHIRHGQTITVDGDVGTVTVL